MQLACLNQSLDGCELIRKYFDQVSARTNGRVDIEVTHLQNQGVAPVKSLRELRSGALEFSEIYSGYVTEYSALLELGDLPGLSQDLQTRKQILDALREYEIKIMRERYGGELLFYNYYPGLFIYSKKPINTPMGFQGLRVRSTDAGITDLVRGLGADPIDKPLSQVYDSLNSGELAAAVTALQVGDGQGWPQVSEYLAGP